LKTGKKYRWSKQAVAEQNGRSLRMYLGEPETMESWSLELPLRGTMELPACSCSIAVEWNKNLRPNKNTRAVLDSDFLDNKTLVLRNRRDGDWFCLANAGRKKLSDYFIDEKIPLEKRDKIPLLAIGSQILWIVGYRQCVAKGRGNVAVTLKKF
ncbi:MAG: tRNA lysidine(34) synthetase TilS, partial [Bacillota bacterium]|nr:tRNA lysidine(34) synthetase TilS [Bacillota bacterium]